MSAIAAMSIGPDEADTKTHLSKLLERAHAGEEIILAKAGKPYARLMPLAPKGSRRGGQLPYRHGLRAGSYPTRHSDPFDRMLAAQAGLKSLTPGPAF